MPHVKRRFETPKRLDVLYRHVMSYVFVTQNDNIQWIWNQQAVSLKESFRESDFAPKDGEESDDFAAGASISCAFLLEARDSWERSFSTSSKHVCGRLGILRKELWAKFIMQRVCLQRGYCTNYRRMLDVQQGGRWFSGRFQGCDRW